MFSLKVLFAALGLLVTPVAAAPTVALKADEVIDKVQKYYVETKKLEASFRQDYTNTTFGKSSSSDGKLFVQKPGKMRWDYKKPEEKHFISDGTTLWVYEPNNKQVFKESLKDEILPVAVTFLYGQGDLHKDFTAELDTSGTYGGKEDLVVKLTPNAPSAQYKKLWLVIDPTDFHVKESVILEASDNTNHFTFFKVKLNAEAKNTQDNVFVFVPPAGVKVVVPQPAAPPTEDDKPKKPR